MTGLLVAAALLLQDLPSRSLAAHGQGTTIVRLTPDGKLLLTCGVPDRSVKVWIVQSGKLLYTLAEQAECLALRPDGGLVAIGSATQTTIWNLVTGLPVHTLESGRTVALSWSVDGAALTTLALTGEKGKAGSLQARIWDFPAAEPRKPVLIPLAKVPSTFAVAPGGTSAAVPHWEGGLRIWDLAKDRVVLEVSGARVTGVFYSPDGRVLATTSSDHALRFLDAASGKELKALIGGYENGATLAFSADGGALAIGADAGIELWDPKTWIRSNVLYGGPGTGIFTPASIELGADGRSLLAGGILVAKDAPASGRLSGPVYFWKLRR